MKYRCLIVEDELPAQRVLKTYIGDLPQLELAGTCNNAMDALELLSKEAIDILFLDIQLPKLTGVKFLRSLKNPPQTIFTTAYSDYAIEGFELDAVDYLLKPFSFERFVKAVNKAIDRAHKKSDLAVDSGENVVFFKTDKKIVRLDLQDLLFIEGLKDYVKVVTAKETNLVLQTLKHWETILPESMFKRVHKSFIVNLNRINRISGNIIVISDQEVPIGRHYREALQMEIEKRSIN